MCVWWSSVGWPFDPGVSPVRGSCDRLRRFGRGLFVLSADLCPRTYLAVVGSDAGMPLTFTDSGPAKTAIFRHADTDVPPHATAYYLQLQNRVHGRLTRHDTTPHTRSTSNKGSTAS